MATFKITKTTTVAKLKKQFRDEFGGTLRVYDGRSEAPDTATLVSLGASAGTVDCGANRTVGKFIEAFRAERNLKVKVYTPDNWVAVLDGITLATVKEIPNGATKAKMESFVAYQREGGEAAAAGTDTDTETIVVPNQFKGIPLVDLDFKEYKMDYDDIMDLGSELEVPGAILIYAYDDDGDFVAEAWCGNSIYNLLDDDCLEFTNQYEGERLVKYFISKQMDTYGFHFDDLDESDECDQENIIYRIQGAITTALNHFVGGHRGSWELETPILVRAKFENHTDIFTTDNDGYFEGTWELDKEFPELVRLTLAGKNVREFPQIPLYCSILAQFDFDNLMTSEPDDIADMIKEGKKKRERYGGAIIWRITLENGERHEICIREKDIYKAVYLLQQEVRKFNCGIDSCDYAVVLIESKSFNPDGSDGDADKALEIIPQLFMRYARYDNLPEWNGEPCLFYCTHQSQRGNRTTYILQFNEEGEIIEEEVTTQEVEAKFGLGEKD